MVFSVLLLCPGCLGIEPLSDEISVWQSPPLFFGGRVVSHKVSTDRGERKRTGQPIRWSWTRFVMAGSGWKPSETLSILVSTLPFLRHRFGVRRPSRSEGSNDSVTVAEEMPSRSVGFTQRRSNSAPQCCFSPTSTSPLQCESRFRDASNG